MSFGFAWSSCFGYTVDTEIIFTVTEVHLEAYRCLLLGPTVWDLHVFGGVEAPLLQYEHLMCAQIFVPALAPSEIRIIFCRHIPYVVLACSANYWPNCSESHELAAILN